MATKEKTEQTPALEQWTERDLTAAAVQGALEPAFGLDDQVMDLCELLSSGARPVLIGESGVGKTAAVHELVRRTVAGSGPEVLTGRRVLQVSIARRAAALRHKAQVAQEFERFVAELHKRGDEVALFIRDLDVVYSYDLETQLGYLALDFPGPIVCEGRTARVEAMFEADESLHERFTCIRMEEPAYSKAKYILSEWVERQYTVSGKVYSGDAVDQALALSHRFLARSRLPRKAIDLLRHAGQSAKSTEVDACAVIERFCAAHRTPRALIDPAVPMDLDAVQSRMAEQVIGQDEAVEAVVQTMGVIKAGLSDLRRPMGVFLFVGPTGVGKTLLAQLLAEQLFGDRDRLIRLNMADFPSESGAAHLFGDSREYELPAKRGLITQRLMGRPFGVLLLDEFEKAHEKVHDRFLQLVDEGCFTNGLGESVSCRSMVIVATSNAGAELQRGEAFGFAVGDDRTCDRASAAAVEKRFRFELLNRFDRVICFRMLGRGHAAEIAVRVLRRLAQRFGTAQRSLTLEFDSAVVEWVVDRGYDDQRGARALNRTIERYVTAAIARVLAGAYVTADSRIRLRVDGGRVVASVEQSARVVSWPRAAVQLMGQGRPEEHADDVPVMTESGSDDAALWCAAFV